MSLWLGVLEGGQLLFVGEGGKLRGILAGFSGMGVCGWDPWVSLVAHCVIVNFIASSSSVAGRLEC